MSQFEDNQGAEFNPGMDAFERINLKRLEDTLDDVFGIVNGILKTRINGIAFDPQGRILATGPRCGFVKIPQVESDAGRARPAFWTGYQFMMPDFYESREFDIKDYTLSQTDSSSVRVAVTPEKRQLSIGPTPFRMRLLDLRQFRNKQYETLRLDYEDVNNTIDFLDSHRELVKDTLYFDFMHEVGEYIIKKNKKLNSVDKQHAWEVFEGSIDSLIERLNSADFKKDLVERAMNQYDTITNVKENLLKTAALLRKHSSMRSEILCYEAALRYFSNLLSMEEATNPNFWEEMTKEKRTAMLKGIEQGYDKNMF